MNRSRTALTALSIVSVLALGACSGDDPEPKFADPTPSESSESSEPASPSTTAVSGPVEPTMPAAAQGTDAAAAEAFVKFYWEMVNYAQATGDVESLSAITDSSCAACRGGIEALRKIFAHDGTVTGGVSSLSGLRTGHLKNDKDRVVVWFDLSTTRQLIDYEGERRDEVYRPSTVKLMAVLHHDGGRWALEYWGEDG